MNMDLLLNPIASVPRDRYVLLINDQPGPGSNAAIGKWDGDTFQSRRGHDVGGIDAFTHWMETEGSVQ